MLIKICGLMDLDTARFAVKQGADYIGLLFSKVSTRALSLEKAKEIVAAVRAAGGEPVAVFADETLEEEKAAEQAMACLSSLKSQNPRSEAAALRARIKAAERQGDLEEAMRLAQELDQRSRAASAPPGN